MIDWEKPIETVDGHQARYIRGMANGSIVYVLGGPGRCGDVFIVNDEGYRCDDRAIYSKRQEPFIRNVPVKREGWMAVYRGKIREGVRDSSPLYETREECVQLCSGNKVAAYVKVEWEEYPCHIPRP